MSTKGSSSSKGSSKSKGLSVMESKTTSNNNYHMIPTYNLIIGIIYNIIILYYVFNLENEDCNCIRDWRHDFIKYYTIAMLIWITIGIIFQINKKSELAMVILNTSMFLGLINIYCLYTYVGDLEKTRCACAIVKTKNSHYFLYVWRYVLVLIIVLALVGVILGSLAQLK